MHLVAVSSRLSALPSTPIQSSQRVALVPGKAAAVWKLSAERSWTIQVSTAQPSARPTERACSRQSVRSYPPLVERVRAEDGTGPLRWLGALLRHVRPVRSGGPCTARAPCWDQARAALRRRGRQPTSRHAPKPIAFHIFGPYVSILAGASIEPRKDQHARDRRPQTSRRSHEATRKYSGNVVCV